MPHLNNLMPSVRRSLFAVAAITTSIGLTGCAEVVSALVQNDEEYPLIITQETMASQVVNDENGVGAGSWWRCDHENNVGEEYANVFQLNRNGSGQSYGMLRAIADPTSAISWEIYSDDFGTRLVVNDGNKEVHYTNVRMMTPNTLSSTFTNRNRLSPIPDDGFASCRAYSDSQGTTPMPMRPDMFANGSVAVTVGLDSRWDCAPAPGSQFGGMKFTLAMIGGGAIEFNHEPAQTVTSWEVEQDSLTMNRMDESVVELRDIRFQQTAYFYADVYLNNDRVGVTDCSLVRYE